ncbi:hypothetical protein ACRAVF_19030 [Bradyrhizobium oligotrophicum S58]
MSSFRAFQNNFALIDFSKEIVLPEPKAERPEPKRSDLPCPRLASDIMEPVQSMVSGKFYDSKSALRAEYRATGHVEKGNDRRPPWKMPRTPRAVIKETVRKAVARVERGERNIHRGK